MLLKQECFLEREKNSPLLNRSGIKRDTDLLMILPKFRHILRLVRIKNKKLMNNSNESTTVNRSVLDSKSGPPELGPSGFTKTDTTTTADTTRTVQNNTKLDELVDAMGKLNVESKPGGTDAVDEMKRIFRLDAERTFLHQRHREIFYENLCQVYYKLGDYHQGEGFVVALFSIYMNDTEIVEVMDYLNNHVLKGYFSSKPKSYVRDAKVLMKLLNEVNPKLHDKLDSLIVPEAFVSKWFIGLFIHVFDFETVADCIDYLIELGQIFLFKLGLSFVCHHEKELLSTNDVSYALQLLRLDEAIMPKEDDKRSEVYRGILSGMFNQKCEMQQVEKYRKEVEEEMAKEEERRKKFEYEDEDEIVFSDEE